MSSGNCTSSGASGSSSSSVSLEWMVLLTLMEDSVEAKQRKSGLITLSKLIQIFSKELQQKRICWFHMNLSNNRLKLSIVACGGAHSNILQPASDFNVAMKAQDSLEPSAGDHSLGNEIAVVSEVAVTEQDCDAQVDAVSMSSLVNGIFSPSTHPSPPGIYDGLSGNVFNGPPPGVGNGPSPGIYNATAAHICNAPGVFNATAPRGCHAPAPGIYNTPAPGVYVYGATAPGVYDAAAPQVHDVTASGVYDTPDPGVYGAPAPHVHNVTAPGIYNGPHSIFNNWSGVYSAGICGLPGVYGAGIYGPPGAYGQPGIYSPSGIYGAGFYGAGVHDPDVYNPAQNPAHNFAQAHGPGIHIQYGTPARSHGLSRYHPY
ncbi:MAG: hypothetical protein NXY57DRAFT_1043967 [Lentinula lateritia]|nr:MAG: hypothetical protein NXY57DRAFT_1043967 [Lentinula lateritia]